MGLKKTSITTDPYIVLQLTREVSLRYCYFFDYYFLNLSRISGEGTVCVFLLLLTNSHLLLPGLDMPFKVIIITDSRGGFLQHFLNHFNENQNVSYTTLVLKGRRVEELWLQARTKLNSKEYDHVYVLGGICNLTSAYFYNRIRSFWPLRNMEDLAYDLIHSLNIIANEALFLGHWAKLTFLPETGADLMVYNNVEYPAHWMLQCQVGLNINIFHLYEATKNINSRLGCTTPWTFDCIYGRNRHGNFYLKFSKLCDGLHPTPGTAADMARKIIKDVNHLLRC